MMRRVILILCVCMLGACNLPNATEVPPLTSPEPDVTPQALATPTKIPIETLLALPTATFAPTATARSALVVPRTQAVNCRFGPSTAFAVVGVLEVGRQAEVVGKNIDVSWWYVKNPSDPSTLCWLAAEVVNVAGKVDVLPVVETTQARVSNVQIRFEPPSLNVGCTSFPQFITVHADIYTNGPATVTWRWETSEGEVLEREALAFYEFGVQSVFTQYKIATAKDYWVQVHVLTPNDFIGQATFKATCTP